MPPTTTDCWTCGAGTYVESPVWLASMVQVPRPVKPTVVPVTVQTPSDDGAMLSTTGSGDAPPRTVTW